MYIQKKRDNIITDEEHIINKHTEVNIYEDEFRKIQIRQEIQKHRSLFGYRLNSCYRCISCSSDRRTQQQHKKATISEQAASTEPKTINEIETEPESETTSAEVTEQETTEATTVEASKVSPPNTNKSSSSDKSSPAKEKPTQKSSVSKSNTKPKQETVTTSPQQTEHVWTQAKVDAVVTEIKQYAIDKGFVINSRLTTQGTSWRNPASTESTPERVKSRLHYCVDDIYTMGMNRFGYIPEESYLNVVAQQYTDSDGNTQWEIYVVY